MDLSQDGVQMLGRELERAREAWGTEALARVEAVLQAMRAGESPARPAPGQRAGLLFPELRAQRWWPELGTPIEASFAGQREQLLAEFEQVSDRPMPLVLHDNFAPEGSCDAIRELVPRTWAWLRSLPRLGEFALISSLAPGERLEQQLHPTNLRPELVLGLVVPAGNLIEIGDEERELAEGRCLAFDGSFVHATENRSDQPRVALVFDVWHPDLNDAEIEFLRRVGPLLAKL